MTKLDIPSLCVCIYMYVWLVQCTIASSLPIAAWACPHAFSCEPRSPWLLLVMSTWPDLGCFSPEPGAGGNWPLPASWHWQSMLEGRACNNRGRQMLQYPLLETNINEMNKALIDYLCYTCNQTSMTEETILTCAYSRGFTLRHWIPTHRCSNLYFLLDPLAEHGKLHMFHLALHELLCLTVLLKVSPDIGQVPAR